MSFTVIKPTAPSQRSLPQGEGFTAIKPAEDTYTAVDRNPEQDNNFLQSIVMDPLKTLLVKPAIRTGQAAGALIAKGLGADDEKLQAALNKNVDFNFGPLGSMRIEPQKQFGEGGGKQILGDVLKTGSYLAPAGRAGQAVGSIAKGKIASSALSGATAGGIGGGLYSSGAAIQEPESTFAGAVGQGLVGAGIGAAAGGVLGGAAGAVGKAVDAYSRRGEIVKNASENYYRDIYQQTQKEMLKDDRMGRDTVKFIAERAPLIDSSGKRVNSTKAIRSFAGERSLVGQEIDTVLKESGASGTLESAKRAALEAIDARPDLTARKKEELIKELVTTFDKEIQSTKASGDTPLPLDTLRRIKTAFGQEAYTPEGMTRHEAEVIASKAVDSIIKKSIGEIHPQYLERFENLNDLYGTYSDAIRLMSKTRNIPSSFFTSLSGRMLGFTGGYATGGPAGGIAGLVTEDKVAGALQDPKMRTQLVNYLLKATDQSPTTVQQAMNKTPIYQPKIDFGQDATRTQKPINFEYQPSIQSRVSSTNLPTTQTTDIASNVSRLGSAGAKASNISSNNTAISNNILDSVPNAGGKVNGINKNLTDAAYGVAPIAAAQSYSEKQGNIFTKIGDAIRPVPTTAQLEESSQQSLLPSAVRERKEQAAIDAGLVSLGGPTLSDQDFYNNRDKYFDPLGAAGTMKRITTKLLSKLAGRTTVSRQFIEDLTNSPDLKQVERDLIRNMLTKQGDKVNVPDFTKKVEAELLPLKARSLGGDEADGLRYESVNLPENLRGPVYKYDEVIYESPIKTSAGNVHFSGDTENYMAHVRREDLAKGFDELGQPDMEGKTRRIIEIQSDLFQKGRLESETPKYLSDIDYLPKSLQIEFQKNAMREMALENAVNSAFHAKEISDINKRTKELFALAAKAKEKTLADRRIEISKLEPYRNTWHERVIREEVAQAAKDGKTKLQFPTGETAMKIEGLGENIDRWNLGRSSGFQRLKIENLKTGLEVQEGMGNQWIVTDVLGDGKFKAVPKRYMSDDHIAQYVANERDLYGLAKKKGYIGEFNDFDIMSAIEKIKTDKQIMAEVKQGFADLAETFDISGKVDTNNPIYKFYEKEVGKYLANKYKAKLVTDPQGVKWWEMDVPKDAGKLPVEAFGAAAIPAVGFSQQVIDSQDPNKQRLQKAVKGLDIADSARAPLTKVETELKPSYKKAYDMFPNIPKGMLEMITDIESAVGTNRSKYDATIGQYAWLTGMTDIAKLDLQERAKDSPIFEKDAKGRYINKGIDTISTKEAAILNTAAYLDLMIRNGNANMEAMEKLPDDSIKVVDAYEKLYKTLSKDANPLTEEVREKLRKAYKKYRLRYTLESQAYKQVPPLSSLLTLKPDHEQVD